MIQYQYKVVTIGIFFKSGKTIDKAVEDKCNELSDQGWELFHFESDNITSKVILIFRKEKGDY